MYAVEILEVLQQVVLIAILLLKIIMFTIILMYILELQMQISMGMLLMLVYI